MKRILSFSILIIWATTLFAQSKPNKQAVLDIINKVNNYWQTANPNPGNPFWDVAAYHTGNMEAYAIT